jgi:signal transduction histidine kinase
MSAASATVTPLYAYSLIPVLAVSLLLFFSLLFYGRSLLGLLLYCASIAAWSGTLVLLSFPATPDIIRRFAQVGAFVSASFIHAAYDFTRQRSYAFVWFVYAVALAITLIGIVWPGMLYSPETLAPGPAFWPAHILALGAALIPLWSIARAYPATDEPGRRQLRTLAMSGAIGFLGAWINSIALTHGFIVPIPMLMVLASLLLLTGLLQQIQEAAGRRLLERSLLYAAMTAFLWAGFLFGLMALMSQTAEPFLRQYRLGALFLLCMAALAFEPLRQHLQQLLSRFLLSGHAASHDLATELAKQEQRADHAQRLAELGTFVSAVAHEIRNPLGVIAAHLRVLQSDGASAEAVSALREQVQRASTFIDDLLLYGRPRPLELRLVDMANILRLAHSTAAQAEAGAGRIEWRGFDSLSPLVIEADQAQLMQVFTILFSNAIQALHEHPARTCRVAMGKEAGDVWVEIDDSGPGIPAVLGERIFEPFVSGRKREGKRSGTGLGLAIARGIVERHHGGITAGRSDLGGARFRVILPIAQRIVSNGATA